jgi:short chain dehydrogenase
MDLQGQRVVILGGTSGIGLATAKAAARCGAEVTVISRQQASVDRALAELPPGAGGWAADLTDPALVGRLFGDLGDIDHLVFTGMRPGSPWPAPAESIVCGTDVDREIPIDLQYLAYQGGPALGGEERVAIVTINPAGQVISHQIPPAVYSEIHQQVTHTRVGNEPVGIEMNEIGPYLTFPVSGRAARNLVSTVADRILLETEPDIGIATVVQNPAADTTALMFDMTAAGPAQLAGLLTDWRTVRLVRPNQPRTVSWHSSIIGPDARDPAARDSDAHSLSELSRYPFLPVPYGPLEVALDLPWGTWSQTIDVPKDEVKVVKLPAAVGVPPLRVRLAGDWPIGSGVAGLGHAPNKASLHDLRRGRERQLSIEQIASDKWAVHLPGWNQPPKGQRVIRLAWPDGTGVRVPAALDRRLGIETSIGGIRVEPLSKAQQPLWDLLATAGRLDALDAAEAQQLSYGKWEDPVLGVAAAYALETRHADLLPTVIGI